MKKRLLMIAAAAAVVLSAGPVMGFESEFLDRSPTSPKITFIGHGTLMFRQGATVIHVDPWGQLADYGKLPKADLVLITHEHRDHLDPKAVGTPGVFYGILKQFMWGNINVVEIVSTYTEFIIILKKRDVDRAFSVLKTYFWP